LFRDETRPIPSCRSCSCVSSTRSCALRVFEEEFAAMRSCWHLRGARRIFLVLFRSVSRIFFLSIFVCFYCTDPFALYPYFCLPLILHVLQASTLIRIHLP